MPLCISYSPNYFTFDDILATQERIPCKFVVDVPKLGKLNPSAEEDDLKAGTNLELPLWLVQEMSSGRQPIVGVEIPKVYRESYREILKADASAVDLYKFGLYFYELGFHAKQFDRRGDVEEILIHAFKTRFRYLMDLADNTISDLTVYQKLDMLERRLLKDSQEARVKLNIWLKDSSLPIQAAEMVVNHKKRKRIEDDEIM